MTPSKLLVIISCFIFPLVAEGQNRNTPFRTSKNFFSYELGVAYPFYEKNSYYFNYKNGKVEDQYTFSKRGINYGLHAGVGYGHFFGKIFSMTIAVSLMYSKFASADFHAESYTPDDLALIKEMNGSLHFSHLSFVFPLDFNFRVSKTIEMTLGVFILDPKIDHEYFVQSGYQYLGNFAGHYYIINPPKKINEYERDYKNYRSFARGGIHGQVSLQVGERDWRQKKILVEYYYSLTTTDYEIHEQWIRIGFSKIFFQ